MPEITLTQESVTTLIALANTLELMSQMFPTGLPLTVPGVVAYIKQYADVIEQKVAAAGGEWTGPANERLLQP